MKLYRYTLWAQAIYTFVTAVWGLADIDSFMAVTGPKTDIWLVKTVSVLLVAISTCFITALLTRTEPFAVIVLAVCSSLGLISIDMYYALNGTISPIYLCDAALQVVFVVLWIIISISLLR